jgi:hypothetical protein
MFTLAVLATFAVYLLPLIIALARRVRPVPRAGDHPFTTDGCVSSLDHVELGLRDQPHARRRTHSALTCVNMGVMVDRYRAPGGWSVQVIHLTATSDNRDGEWLRVSYCGVWVADVRSPGELEQWFPLASLEEEVLVLRAKGHPRGSEGWITLSKLFRRQPNWCVIAGRVWFIGSFRTSRIAIAIFTNVGAGVSESRAMLSKCKKHRSGWPADQHDLASGLGFPRGRAALARD